MAGHNRPAIILAGIAGLSVSAAAGVTLGSYSASGMNPIYGQAHLASAYAEQPLVIDGNGSETRSVDQISEAAARTMTGDSLAERSNDES